MKRLLPAVISLALAGCAADQAARPVTAASSPAPPAAAGVARVMNQDARTLGALFGPAALDLREGPAHKLQWRGPACILDAYLYPPGGGGEPRVTWIDARTPVGVDMDRASCIAALARVKSPR